MDFNNRRFKSLADIRVRVIALNLKLGSLGFNLRLSYFGEHAFIPLLTRRVKQLFD